MSLASSLAGGGGGSSGGAISGSTGTADNRLLRSDGTGGSTLQNTGITASDTDQLSGNLLGIKSAAGGQVLTAADSGKCVSLTVGAGADSVTLPAAPTAGTWYIFDIIGTDELTIQATGSHVIRVGTTASSAGGTLKSSTQGSVAILHYAAANQWLGVASGTWTAA